MRRIYIDSLKQGTPEWSCWHLSHLHLGALVDAGESTLVGVEEAERAINAVLEPMYAKQNELCRGDEEGWINEYLAVSRKMDLTVKRWLALGAEEDRRLREQAGWTSRTSEGRWSAVTMRLRSVAEERATSQPP